MRPATWNGLVPERSWPPGSEAIVLEGGKNLDGYAIFTRQPFGHRVSPFVVDEFTSRDVEAAPIRCCSPSPTISIAVNPG